MSSVPLRRLPHGARDTIHPASPGLTIRRATAGDAQAIGSLYLASRDDALPGLHNAHTDDEVRGWIARVLLPRDDVWIAERDGTALGFIALHDGWVEQLYLAPTCYRQGIGTALLAIAKRHRPTGLRLFCFQRNSRARAFYEANGFTAVRFSDGSDNEEREPDIEYLWVGA
jgi:GNAT superfamily N-acetyltransferase